MLRRSHLAAMAAYLAIFSAPGVGGTVAGWSDQASSGTFTFTTGTWSDEVAHLDLRVTAGLWEGRALAIVDVLPSSEVDPQLIIQRTVELRVGGSDAVGAEEVPAIYAALTPASARRFAFPIDGTDAVTAMQQACLSGRIIGGTPVHGCANLEPIAEPRHPEDGPWDVGAPEPRGADGDEPSGAVPDGSAPDPGPAPLDDVSPPEAPAPLDEAVQQPPAVEAPPIQVELPSDAPGPAAPDDEAGEEPEQSLPGAEDPAPADIEILDVVVLDEIPPADDPLEPALDQIPAVPVATRPSVTAAAPPHS